MKMRFVWGSFWVAAMIGIAVYIIAGEPLKAVVMVISASMSGFLLWNEMKKPL